MTRHASAAVSTTNLEAHPAVRAWVALGVSGVVPVEVETLKKERGGQLGVYRLCRADSRGTSVVAKRCALDDAWHERTVYENVLPHLPLATVRYYGFVSDSTNSVGWLFLGDAGETPYSPRLRSHRPLAAAWLGILHSQAGDVAKSAALPDRGLAWYRTRLEAARGLLQRALDGGTTGGSDAVRLEHLSKWCTATVARWAGVVASCEGIPSTLVHADFVGENVRVRDEGHGLVLLPFDWGTSGWGIPARDLVGLDIGDYHAAVRERWPDVGVADLQRLARVGRLFRRIAAIHRACLSLPYRPVDKVISDMRYLAVRA